MGASQSQLNDPNYNQYIPAALSAQDLERIKFASNIKQNPDEYRSYVNQRVDELSNEVFQRKRAAFQKAHIDLGRYVDMDHNANFYKSRAGDVDRLTTLIGAGNNATMSQMKHDLDLSRRQFEINEWHNNNKLETLFFLQVFFIVALLMAIIIYNTKNGTIHSSTASLLTFLLFLTVLTIGVYRYYYTRRIRDPRLWHRRYFGGAKPPKPPVQCSSGGEPTIDLNDYISKDVTECADQATQNFSAWQDNLSNELAGYIDTGTTTDRLLGKGQGLVNLVCNKN